MPPKLLSAEEMHDFLGQTVTKLSHLTDHVNSVTRNLGTVTNDISRLSATNQDLTNTVAKLGNAVGDIQAQQRTTADALKQNVAATENTRALVQTLSDSVSVIAAFVIKTNY